MYIAPPPMSPSLAASLSYLLIFPFQQPVLEQSSCLSGSLYGIFDAGNTAVFVTTPQCFESAQHLLPEDASVISIPSSFKENKSLVWFEPEHVDQAFFSPFTADTQTLLSDAESSAAMQSGLLYQSGRMRLYALDKDFPLETPADPYLSMSILPSEPINFIPVPSDAVKRVKKLAEALEFDPVIASIVNDLSVTQMRRDIRWLTGEADNSPIVSRHSFADGSRVAARWLKERFEEQGASCELKTFMVGFAPNVVCRFTGTANTDATVLISAHYDSRGSFGSTRAPGANDDGSGTTALLNIARTIAKRGVRFRNNVELVAFAGEEQGLYGSRGYARELRQKDANLILMIQADMLAYRAPGEPPQLGLPDIIGTPEVTSYVANISSIYSPELVVGSTPACCSDHQSFHEQGFPATQVYERAGPIVDPMYHNSGDLSDRPNYDLDQVRSIAKVQFATLLHAAGFTVRN